MEIKVRKSKERGYSDLGWLKTFYTFSFSNYFDKDFINFGCLRVLNEDKIKPNKGFPKHSHRDYNIFTYVISGELTHNDSEGNTQVIKRNQVQYTRTGTGIWHSEYNYNPKEWVHLLQIWFSPNQFNLKPLYITREFSEEDKKNKLCEILSFEPKNDQCIKIESDVKVFASILEPKQVIEYNIPKKRKVYIHLVMKGGKLKLNDEITLDAGDGAFIIPRKVNSLKIESEKKSEFLLFDVEN